MSELVKQVRELEGLDLAQVQAKYQELFGEEPISRNRKVLLEQIKRRLHENDIAAQREQQQPGGAKPAGDIITRVHELRHMSLEALRAEHERVFGQPSKSRNRKQLFVKIAKRVQEDELRSKPKDGVPKPTLVAKFERKPKARSRRVTKAAGREKKAGAKSETRSRVKPIGSRDPRLPKPGTTIEREWHGKKYLVRVMQPGLGFEYDGKPFRSLSAVAKYITGQIVNGFLWWGLIPREDKKEKAGK